MEKLTINLMIANCEKILVSKQNGTHANPHENEKKFIEKETIRKCGASWSHFQCCLQVFFYFALTILKLNLRIGTNPSGKSYLTCWLLGWRGVQIFTKAICMQFWCKMCVPSVAPAQAHVAQHCFLLNECTFDTLGIWCY